jgi:hypothetical protein
MKTLGAPFAKITEFIFTRVGSAGWDAYQDVAGWITLLILILCVSAFYLYYHVLKSVTFDNQKSYILVGTLASAFPGWFAYHKVYDLGISQNNLQPVNDYDELLGMAIEVGLIAFFTSFIIYFLFSLIHPLRKSSRDIPLTLTFGKTSPSPSAKKDNG